MSRQMLMVAVMTASLVIPASMAQAGDALDAGTYLLHLDDARIVLTIGEDGTANIDAPAGVQVLLERDADNRVLDEFEVVTSAGSTAVDLDVELDGSFAMTAEKMTADSDVLADSLPSGLTKARAAGGKAVAHGARAKAEAVQAAAEATAQQAAVTSVSATDDLSLDIAPVATDGTTKVKDDRSGPKSTKPAKPAKDDEKAPKADDAKDTATKAPKAPKAPKADDVTVSTTTDAAEEAVTTTTDAVAMTKAPKAKDTATKAPKAVDAPEAESKGGPKATVVQAAAVEVAPVTEAAPAGAKRMAPKDDTKTSAPATKPAKAGKGDADTATATIAAPATKGTGNGKK